MKAKSTFRWRRLRAGKHSMTGWIGDTQCTYVAVRGEAGWVLTRHVAGATKTVVWEPTATLREAKELAAADLNNGVF